MSGTIKIFQGDADTLTEVITGLASLSGYAAILYLKTRLGVEVDTIEGDIEDLTITYEIVNEASKDYPVGRHCLESKIFDLDDHVYTTSSMEFVVEEPLEDDPL